MQTLTKPVAQKNNSNYAEIVHYELTKLLYERFLFLAIMNCILGVFLAVLLWDKVLQNTMMMGFVSSLIVLSITPVVFRFRFQRTKLSHKKINKWQILLIVIFCIQGCIWSFATILFFNPLDIVMHFTLIIITLFITITYAIIITDSKIVFYFFIAPVILATGFRVVLTTNLELQFIEIACLILECILVIFYSRLHNAFLKILISNDQKTQQVKAFQHANTNKSRFLAAVSHDLRQPLQAHRLHIADLKRNVTDFDNKKIIQNLELSTKAMSDMFSTLLDIAKLDSGTIKPDIQHFKIADIFDDIIVDFSAVALDKDLCFKVVDSSIILRSDSILLKRIIRNLVSNAIKYTNSGGILIGCRRKRNNTVAIEVWDTGIGIPDNQIKSIFNEYSQLNDASFENHNGIGLGLAIVKRLAFVLNHELTVHSNINQGSVFSTSVPIGDSNKIDSEIQY